MEVVVPVKGMNFSYTSAPSTPRPMGDPYYFSAPTSPTRLSEFCHEFEDLLIAENNRNSCATVPFAWEERPGKPKSPNKTKYEDDFAFDVSGEFGSFDSLSAEDLFDGGVIKPLKPPPRLQLLSTGENKKIIRSAFSPREEKEANMNGKRTPERERGRERVISALTSPSRRTRSLSPLRVSEYPWEEEQTKQSTTTNPKPPLPSTPSALSASSSKGSKKWRLKDLFLFRSASDGRAMDRDPFRKYTALLRKHEDFRNSSLRAIEYNGSGSRRRGPVSAHELHYTVNRAVSNDMKKKTFLPYKQGILGRLAFNPAVNALANGFGLQHK